ncbi:MAG: hypothetical protein PHW83_08135 [Bacteroidales bacterium]|nr:hypothetical protein [Bacteroidales bacterium]
MKTTIIILITFLAVIYSNRICSQTANEHYEQGIKYLDQQQYQESVQSFDATIKLDTAYTRAFLMRGLAKLYNEEYFGAIEDFNKVIEYNPDNRDAYLYRSQAKEKIGDIGGAKKDKGKSDDLLNETENEEDLGFD